MKLQIPATRLLFLATLFSAPLSASAPYALDDAGTWAKPSATSQRLLLTLKHWPPATLTLHDERPEVIRAIKTPGNEDLIGMVKHFEVNESLARVVAVNEDFDAYPKLWENVLGVKVESRDINRVVTQWTRKAPAFFLPKIHYRMISIADKSETGKVIYRNQLIDGNMIKTSDSLVVFEQLDPNRTRVSVLNFFTPDVGHFRAIAAGRIWKQSMQDAFKDDVAFRARTEHPDWSVDRISEEADQALARFPINSVQYTELLP
jgi:uncharacterized membrane protein